VFSNYALLATIALEILIVALLVAVLLVRRLMTYPFGVLAARKRSKMIAYLMHCIEHDMVSDAIMQYRGCRSLRRLLSVLEDFDKKLKGEEWLVLRAALARRYLFPKAKQLAYSIRWMQRNFAVRSLAMDPSEQEEKILLKLLEDPVFLIQSKAAVALIESESYLGVIKVISKMSESGGYRRCFYRDALLRGSLRVFAWVIRVAMTDKDPKIHLAALEILSTRVIMDPLFFLQSDVISPDPAVRTMAIRTYATNPHYASADIFLEHIHDLEKEVRMEAIAGLYHFREPKVFAALKELLIGSEPQIAFIAAKTLKKMGEQGVDLLRERELNGNQESRLLTQYVLQFD